MGDGTDSRSGIWPHKVMVWSVMALLATSVIVVADELAGPLPETVRLATAAVIALALPLFTATAWSTARRAGKGVLSSVWRAVKITLRAIGDIYP